MSTLVETYLAALDLEFDGHHLDFLNRLHQAHLDRLSFNNLAILLGQRIELDLDTLMDKLLVRRQGGYCFEHNRLVFEVLKALGFEVELKLAQVIYGTEGPAPRTHRITLVMLEGQTWLLDCGFGHYGPQTPLPLVCDQEYQQGFERFKLQQKDGFYTLYTYKEGDFFTLYRFDLADYSDLDCEVSNFYSCAYPKAGFVNHMIVSRKGKEGIFSIRNNEFIASVARQVERTPITDAQQLHQLLNRHFAITVTEQQAQQLAERFIVAAQS